MVPLDGVIPSLVNASGFLETKYLDNVEKKVKFKNPFGNKIFSNENS